MFKIYKRLLFYVQEEKKLVYLAILFAMIGTFFTIMAYYYLNSFFEELIVEKNMEKSLNYLITITSLLVLGKLIYISSVVMSHKVGFRLETNLRKKGIDGLSKASFSFFDLNSSGKTRKVIDDNAGETHAMIAHLIPDNSEAILTSILIIFLSFFISFKVGLSIIILTILSGTLLKLMVGEFEFMVFYQKALERLSNETVEYIRGMQVIKIFGVSVNSFKSLNEAIHNYSDYAHKYSKSCKKPFVLFQFFFFSYLCIIIPIFIFSVDRNISPEKLAVEFIMILFLSGIMFVNIMKVMYISSYLFKGNAAVEKLENLFDEMQKENLSFGKDEKFKNFDIEFDNVSFKYSDKYVLENLSFKLKENRTYALVGASGSGKSTIAKLISGFYKIDKGNIKIGDKNLQSYSEKALIKNISFVFQNPKLFKMSIYDNVKIANENASREDVMKALSLASCDNIINKFKDKENTVIGSKGVYLSGGETQRIVIARAILKDSKIIILDEASAAIDSENEHELQLAFSNLIKGKTVIMIAHRLTSITNADEIILLDKGQIIARGNNDELVEKNSEYRELKNLYNKANEWRI